MYGAYRGLADERLKDFRLNKNVGIAAKKG